MSAEREERRDRKKAEEERRREREVVRQEKRVKDYDIMIIMIMILFISPSLRTVTKFRKDRIVSSLYC